MVWLWWRQHRADRAEAVDIRRYLERHEGHLRLCECISEASRRDDVLNRLNTRLGSASQD